MSDQDIFVFDSDSATGSADSIMVDLSSIDVIGDGTITIDLSNYGAAQPTYTVSGIDTITLDNTDWATDWLADREIIDQHHADKRIRETHPAVQHAWEQYQIMLNLAREDLDDPSEDCQ